MRRRLPYKKHRKISTKAFANRLRDRMTRCELLLWSRLKRFPHAQFEAQVVVCGYIPDFYCHELKLAIEVDGGVHRRPRVRRRDIHKDKVLASHGVTVLRVTNEMVQYNIHRVLVSIRNVSVMLSNRIGLLRTASNGVE